jgi:hypothetical protein
MAPPLFYASELRTTLSQPLSTPSEALQRMIFEAD